MSPCFSFSDFLSMCSIFPFPLAPPTPSFSLFPPTFPYSSLLFHFFPGFFLAHFLSLPSPAMTNIVVCCAHIFSDSVAFGRERGNESIENGAMGDCAARVGVDVGVGAFFCQVIRGLSFQAAVPKSFTMKMEPLSGHDLPPNR